jgi:3',5'-cyclic AMP phosphodiesterase CpdA
VDGTSGPVHIVAFDVTVPSKHHGEVTGAALSSLDGGLAAEPGRPTVIMMHQQPLVCGVPYLDKYCCFGADRLEQVVSRHKSVQRILCGHVHRYMQLLFGGTLLCSAPATTTAIALRPFAGAEPASFLEPPGFLLHYWRDQGGMLTHSVPIGDFAGPFPFA